MSKMKLIQVENDRFLLSMPSDAEIEVFLHEAYEIQKPTKACKWLSEPTGMLSFELSVEIHKNDIDLFLKNNQGAV